MKRFLKVCLLFVASFTIGTIIAPLFKIETIPDTNTINEPDSRPVQHNKDRYGDDIRRIV
jgi:hypothetical protein